MFFYLSVWRARVLLKGSKALTNQQLLTLEVMTGEQIVLSCRDVRASNKP